MGPPSTHVSGVLYQVQTVRFRNGMELDAGRTGAEVHQSEQALVMIGAKVAQQVLAGPPMRLVEESLRGAVFLEDSATDATGLYSSRPRPSCKVSPQPLALRQCDGNADAFDNQIWLPLVTIPVPGTVDRQP